MAVSSAGCPVARAEGDRRRCPCTRGPLPRARFARHSHLSQSSRHGRDSGIEEQHSSRVRHTPAASHHQRTRLSPCQTLQPPLDGLAQTSGGAVPTAIDTSRPNDTVGKQNRRESTPGRWGLSIIFCCAREPRGCPVAEPPGGISPGKAPPRGNPLDERRVQCSNPPRRIEACKLHRLPMPQR